MDLKQYDSKTRANEGAKMHVKHPVTMDPLYHDDETPVTITLAGVDSDQFQAALQERTNRRLKQAMRQPESEDIGAGVLTDSVETLADCTLDWNIEYEGEIPECTPAKAREIYEALPWLKEQVDAFIRNRANYLKN